jgi:hypothetical protein
MQLTRKLAADPQHYEADWMQVMQEETKAI